MRTTNNILGDCYAAAVVEKWSQSELDAMEKPENNEDVNKDIGVELPLQNLPTTA